MPAPWSRVRFPFGEVAISAHLEGGALVVEAIDLWPTARGEQVGEGDGMIAGTGAPPEGGARLRAAALLQAYLASPTTLPPHRCEPRGTSFQRRVWAALLEIPPGRTVTYGGLAARLGSSPRAVGGACRANPVPILIPCHRVVAADGAGGYSGARAGPRLEVKGWLLEHERGGGR